LIPCFSACSFSKRGSWISKSLIGSPLSLQQREPAGHR
jgi:hypothetical protein